MRGPFDSGTGREHQRGDRMRVPSVWLRLVALFLAWIGLRSAWTVILTTDDPNFRLAAELGWGSAIEIAALLVAILSCWAAVAIWRGRRRGLTLGILALAVYAGAGAGSQLQAQANPVAAKRAYAAHRAARGLPVSEDRLNQIFSPQGQRLMWLIAGVMTTLPLGVLLWRRDELNR
jgi:hypothetical protein